MPLMTSARLISRAYGLMRDKSACRGMLPSTSGCLLYVLHDGRDPPLVHDLLLLDGGSSLLRIGGIDRAAHHDDTHHAEEVVRRALIDIHAGFGEGHSEGL